MHSQRLESYRGNYEVGSIQIWTSFAGSLSDHIHMSQLTVLCMEAAGITKFAATSQPYDPQ